MPTPYNYWLPLAQFAPVGTAIPQSLTAGLTLTQIDIYAELLNEVPEDDERMLFRIDLYATAPRVWSPIGGNPVDAVEVAGDWTNRCMIQEAELNLTRPPLRLQSCQFGAAITDAVWGGTINLYHRSARYGSGLTHDWNLYGGLIWCRREQ